MPKGLLLSLNIFFFVFHTVLILFNIVGWSWRKTRKANLVCLAATAISWLVMGLWHGIGYCILTDWHWQIRRQLGIVENDHSYIQLLTRVLTGWTPSDQVAQNVAGIVFAVCVLLSVALNIRDKKLNVSAKGQHPDLPSPRTS